MSTANRTERMWLGAAAALALVIAVVGWFFLISPQRDETADVQGRTADAQMQNLTLQSRINQLGAEKAKWKSYTAALARAKEALPERSDMSVFLRQVQTIAAATGTRVTTLNVGDPTAVTPTTGGSTTGGSTTGAAPSAAGQSGTGSIFAIPIDASVMGRPAALSQFLTRLQSGQPRAVLLTSVTRSAGSGSAVLQLKLNAFVAPSPSAAATRPGGG